jgi:spore maturation protein CgeB
MRVRMFYHSLLSDWNHGNAHFLRGVVSELLARGHDVRVYEPHDSWSLQNLLREHGEAPVADIYAAYPEQKSIRYQEDAFDLDEALEGADLVIVHEWTGHELVRRIGQHRKNHRGYRLLFHDTHHRAVTAPEAMAAYDLSHYDGVLAYGAVLRDIYLERGWAASAWTWHEAADLRVFRPMPGGPQEGDLIWVGNWGDEERSAELREYLLDPIRALGLAASVYGVRYPDHARRALEESGASYGGWLANFKAPQAYAAFKMTVHVPRRPYVEALPGIPTIRVFEALACGIPLVCSPWEDVENLFAPGKDYLVAPNGREMARHLRMLLNEPGTASELARHGRETILSRHSCAHRVDELLAIHSRLVQGATRSGPQSIQGAVPISSA